MNKRIGIGLTALLLVLVILNFDRLMFSKPTEEQSAYFQTQLDQVEYIEIRKHPKLGGDILATIRNPSQINEIKEGIELDRTHPPTGSFGMFDLVFHRSDGSEFRINYSPEQDRIKFENPWGIEGLALGELPSIINKLRSQPVDGVQ